ncbi:sulfite exporter TauE/SafE family protein [Lipingzhangella sp. LS1_29]|uniref:Probable membrane transporter protein n=1 Tax=Lipingzhangella rawalii TaxID=2055835 RepID=A0ABU2H403_9ACTN|nr:sulfite exporter TauE/SafE family protein [Lipingzhangella rawalii]MDS1270037.1 sulfite exporter TauE/SafE family protein [Lipingzhangella rawalii]
MGLWEALAILAAGVGAGAINAVVGSGTLLTFPVLLALGYPPVTATISNSVGLAPGALSGALGYRRELAGQRPRLLRLGAMSALGAVTGGTLLLVLPATVFMAVVPALIVGACLLIVFQPRLQGWVRSRRPSSSNGGRLLPLGIYGAGTYGGYFAAAQGIVLLGLLGTALDEDLQRVNALKNALTFVVNATAAVFYIVLASPVWSVVALIALGSIAGGYLGARFGRRLRPEVLRLLVVVIGLTAAGQLIVDLLTGTG